MPPAGNRLVADSLVADPLDKKRAGMSYDTAEDRNATRFPSVTSKVSEAATPLAALHMTETSESHSESSHAVWPTVICIE